QCQQCHENVKEIAMDISRLKHPRLRRQSSHRCGNWRVNRVLDNGAGFVPIRNRLDEETGFGMRFDFRFLDGTIEKCKNALERISERRRRVFECCRLQSTSTTPRLVITATKVRSEGMQSDPSSHAKHEKYQCHPEWRNNGKDVSCRDVVPIE